MSKKYEYDNVYLVDVGDWGCSEINAKSHAAARYAAFIKFIDAYGRSYYDENHKLCYFDIRWFAEHSKVKMLAKAEQNKRLTARERLAAYEKIGTISELQNLKACAVPGLTFCITRTWQDYTDDIRSALNDPHARASIHTGSIMSDKYTEAQALDIMAEHYGVQKIIDHHAESCRANIWLIVQP